MDSLRRPDDRSWHERKLYSRTAATSLVEAYSAIREISSNPDNYIIAFAQVAPLRHRILLREQRLRVLYVLGMAFTADEDYKNALHHLDEAILLAGQLGDDDALVELYYLRGAINGCIGGFESASEDYRAGLASLRKYTPDGPSQDPSMEITLLAGAAGFDYYLGRFELATEQLDSAQQVSQYVPRNSLEAANIYWIRSHLLRSEGMLDEALLYAKLGADIYTARGKAASAARIQWLAAEIALDRAASLSDDIYSRASASYLDQAIPYIEGAHKSASDANDPIGRGMVLLTIARYDWLTRANRNISTDLHRVKRIAMNNNDTPLLAQTYLAMGSERAARNDIPAARGWYNRALDVLDSSNVEVFWADAYRALNHLDEMHPPS